MFLEKFMILFPEQKNSRIRQDRTGEQRTEQGRTRKERTGQDRRGEDRTIQNTEGINRKGWVIFVNGNEVHANKADMRVFQCMCRTGLDYLTVYFSRL